MIGSALACKLEKSGLKKPVDASNTQGGRVHEDRGEHWLRVQRAGSGALLLALAQRNRDLRVGRARTQNYALFLTASTCLRRQVP